MAALREKLTYANVMATIAVFIALGGGAIAATQLPKNSVGAKQLKKAAVTPAKLSTASKATLTGPPGAKGEPGTPGAPGSALGYAHIIGGKLDETDSKGVIAVAEGQFSNHVEPDGTVICFELAMKPSNISVTPAPASNTTSHIAAFAGGEVPAFPPASGHAGCDAPYDDAEAEAYTSTESVPDGLWVVLY